MSFSYVWDTTFESLPDNSTYGYYIDDYFKRLYSAIKERMQVEHTWALGQYDGKHKTIAGAIDILNTYGDGVNFTQAVIDACLTAIGTSEKKTVILSSGTWVFSSNADWSAYKNINFWFLPGAVLSHGSFTVKITNIDAAPYQQIFSGTGAVTIYDYKNEAYVNWFCENTTPGSTDMGAAINSAVQSIPKKGTVRFLNETYLSTVTLIYKNFVNWRGIRGTTVDSDSSYADTDAKGTVIREHEDLYDGVGAGKNNGVLLYIETGDVSIRDVQFVGTGAINSNNSVGIQWGNSGEGRSFEASTYLVSGIDLQNVGFFAFSKAWEIYSMNDAEMFNPRFESNITALFFDGDAQAKIHGAVLYASIAAISFGDNCGTVDIRLYGGAVTEILDNSHGIEYVSSVAATSVTFNAYGTEFFSVGTLSNVYHVYLAGNCDSGIQKFAFHYCTFKKEKIYTFKTGITGYLISPEFNLCNMNDVELSINWTKEIKFIGGIYDNSPITAAVSAGGDIQSVTFQNVGTAFTTSDVYTLDWNILCNRFMDTVTTPLSIYDHQVVTMNIKGNYGLDWYAVPDAQQIFNSCHAEYFTTNNSSPTVITSIGGGIKGKQVTLHFADAVTTIDCLSGNIRGNDGNPFVGKVNSNAIFTYDGTYWGITSKV